MEPRVFDGFLMGGLRFQEIGHRSEAKRFAECHQKRVRPVVISALYRMIGF